MPCPELQPTGLPQGAGRFYICPAAEPGSGDHRPGTDRAVSPQVPRPRRTGCHAAFPASADESWEANRTPMLLLELFGLFLLRVATRALS